jgi:hypothetical protein
VSIGPVSKLWPSSAVKVCAVLSSLATAIGPSPLTVSVAGLNAKLSILIPLPEEDAALLDDDEPPLDDDEPPLGVGAFAVPDPPQPAINAAAAATNDE